MLRNAKKKDMLLNLLSDNICKENNYYDDILLGLKNCE